MPKALIFYVLFLTVIFAETAYSEPDCHITYGMSGYMKPYEWLDENGRPFGMNIDIINALSKESGCSYEIIVDKYPLLMEKLKKGEIDLVMYSQLLGDFGGEESHMMPLLQLDVYYRYFLSRKDGSYIGSMEDIRGKTALVMSGATSDVFAGRIQERYDLKILKFDSVAETVKKLSEGVGDFAFFEKGITYDILAEGNYNNLRVSGGPIMPAIHSLMMNKSDVNLYLKLNSTVQSIMVSGDYYRILEKWSTDKKNYPFILKIATIGIAALLVLAFFVIFWNMLLRFQVKRKTESLRKSSAENIQLREEAIMVSRLAALGEMASSVAHEINNPAGLIVHNMTYLKRFIKEVSSEADKVLTAADNICAMDWESAKTEAEASGQIITESLGRIKNTVNDLKDYGNSGNDKYGYIDLRNCASSSLRLTNYFTKKYTSNFFVKMPEEPVIVYGNAMRIEEMVINIIQNACFALKDNYGTIECYIEQNNGNAILSIKDNGKGMSEAVKANACNAFFTTRAESGGTGLGLAITARIMKEHSGSLIIESKEDVGTVVKLIFPIARPGGESG